VSKATDTRSSAIVVSCCLRKFTVTTLFSPSTCLLAPTHCRPGLGQSADATCSLTIDICPTQEHHGIVQALVDKAWKPHGTFAGLARAKPRPAVYKASCSIDVYYPLRCLAPMTFVLPCRACQQSPTAPHPYCLSITIAALASYEILNCTKPCYGLQTS